MKKWRITGRLRMATDLRAPLLRSIRSSDEAALKYLRNHFLRSAARQLYSARRAAGVTQVELAERLHTTQSVISRTEADITGAISLRRFVDWLMACQTVPKAVTTVSARSAREAALELLAPNDHAAAASDDHASTAANAGALSASNILPREFGLNAPEYHRVLEMTGNVWASTVTPHFRSERMAVESLGYPENVQYQVDRGRRLTVHMGAFKPIPASVSIPLFSSGPSTATRTSLTGAAVNRR